MADSLPSSIATNILEMITKTDSPQTCFSSNLQREIRKIEETLSTVKVGLLRVETEVAQNRLAHYSKMLNDIADMLHKLASDRPQACKFILSFIHGIYIKGMRKKLLKIESIRRELDTVAATIMCDLDDQLDIRCVYPRDWVVGDTFVDTSEVLGRDADKENVIKSLLKTYDDLLFSYPTVGILGKQGIGKTTLAKLVYNDKKIDDHFDLKMWITVPGDFDIFFMMLQVYSFATNQHPNALDLKTLEGSLESLFTNALSRKKILVVLDNMLCRNEENFIYFQKVLPEAKGSKILVTTHSNKIANDMGIIESHVLEGLSHEDSMSLFMKNAFGDRANNNYPDLVKIVQKCDGIPLVVKTLGTFCRNTDRRDWLPIVYVDFWREIQRRNNILPMLKLSYKSLPTHLQICLKHCSLFPKGFCFNSHYLIRYWMAQDFLLDSNEELEDTGERYLKELFLTSFFQDVVNYGYYFTFKLHDFVHDFLLKEAQNDCQRVDLRVQHSKIQAKYLSFHGIEHGDKEFSYISSHLLAIIMKSSPSQPVSQSFVNRWTSKFKQIRLLCLSGLQFRVLPDSVGSLDQLRYLDLSWNLILKELPEAICKLKRLQTLILLGCSSLNRFPKNMQKMIKLIYLELTTNVRSLLGNKIEYLCSVRYLHLYNCHHLQNLSGKMQCLTNLRTLILQGCYRLTLLPDDMTNLQRLEKLVIHSCSSLILIELQDGGLNLKEFIIYDISEPAYLLQSILKKSANTLEYMRIDSCFSLTTLPPWPTNLTSLKKLEIVRCSLLSSLPSGMKRLTALTDLKIQESPTLSKSCRSNWSSINHVQNIHLDPEVASMIEEKEAIGSSSGTISDQYSRDSIRSLEQMQECFNSDFCSL